MTHATEKIEMARLREELADKDKVVQAAEEWLAAAVESEEDGEDERSFQAGQALFQTVAAHRKKWKTDHAEDAG